jgi:hypothetical protein
MRIVLRSVNERVPSLILAGEAESPALVPMPDLLDEVGQAADRDEAKVVWPHGIALRIARAHATGSSESPISASTAAISATMPGLTEA